jgi:uncharacterized protein (TIGR01777 family)
MDIFVTGGTGFIGSSVVRALTKKGHLVTILTRSVDKAKGPPEGVRFVEGDPTRPGPWQDEVTKHQRIINLAGASVFRKWSKTAKRLILQSRLLTTENIVNALEKNNEHQTYLLNASAVGYYGFCGDDVLDEESPGGDDFLADVTSRWEKTASEAKPLGTRVVLCRIGIVLGKGGGALAQMRKIFERYLGAQLGSGKQWFSWIHQEDLDRIFPFLLENEGIEGPVNCSSPNPVRNKELTQTIAQSLGKPLLFPRVPSFMLKLVLGEFAKTLLQGQRVIPRKLLEKGFEFRYPSLREALDNLLN